MKFRNENGIATLEFDSESEFTEWILGRSERASHRFPGEVEKIGDIGPTSVSRIGMDDDAQVAAAFEKFKLRFRRTITAIRMPLDREFSILQLEVRDSETGTVHLWNIGRGSDFDSVDKRPVSGSSGQPAQDAGKVDEAKAIARFGLAYRALGRSKQFSISVVPPAELKSTRTLFAGYCPRCDGLLGRTGLRVEEHDNNTVLLEERCLDCDQRLLGWRRKGDGQVPPGWKRI